VRPHKLAQAAAAALLAPSYALAHDPYVQLVLTPPIFVPTLVLLTVWAWDASVRSKLLSLVAVSLASVSSLGVNLAILDQRTPIDPNSVFPAMALAPVVVPAIVWMACWRRARRDRSSDDKT
jgi:hypothetical protein